MSAKGFYIKEDTIKNLMDCVLNTEPALDFQPLNEDYNRERAGFELQKIKDFLQELLDS